MSATEPVPGARRAALAFIFVTVVLDMLALGMVVPVLPRLIEDFLGGDTARRRRVVRRLRHGLGPDAVPVHAGAGALSDRYGRRPVVLASNFGLALDYVLMALAPNLAWLFVGRVISGITAASVSTAMAYVADVTPAERRSGAFGLIGAAFGVGFVLGPAIGGLLGSVDPRLPFWAAAAFSLANACYGLFVLPESLPRERRRPFEWRRANPVGSFRLLRSHPELSGLAGVAFLSSVAHAALPSTFVLYAGYRYGWDARAVGLALAGVGASSVLVQGTLVGPLDSAPRRAAGPDHGPARGRGRFRHATGSRRRDCCSCAPCPWSRSGASPRPRPRRSCRGASARRSRARCRARAAASWASRR